MEAFMYQFHSQHTYVQDLLKSGEIGDFLHIKAHFSFKLDDEKDIRLNRDLGGGAIWDIGCYGIHAGIQVVEMKPVHVSMIGKTSDKHNVDLRYVSRLTYR